MSGECADSVDIGQQEESFVCGVALTQVALFDAGATTTSTTTTQCMSSVGWSFSNTLSGSMGPLRILPTCQLSALATLPKDARFERRCQPSVRGAPSNHSISSKGLKGSEDSNGSKGSRPNVMLAGSSVCCAIEHRSLFMMVVEIAPRLNTEHTEQRASEPASESDH